MESQDPDMDSEKGRMPKEYLNGIPLFSAVLASSPDLQVFQRFNRLATRNLLYLQAEMADIEARLNQFDADDLAVSRTSNMDEVFRVQTNAHCWESFRTRAENGDVQERARMDLILRLREAMAQYQDALIRQSEVLKLGVPKPWIRNGIRTWCKNNVPFVGNSGDMYGDISQYDTVPLSSPEQDRLSAFLENHLGYFLRYSKGRKGRTLESEGNHYFPGEVIGHIASFANIVLSAALLIGAITSLYFVKEPSSVIGLLAAFTTMFAGRVGLLTSARKVDVYTATAAYVQPPTSLLDMSDPVNRYAAVLVVFVGNISNEPTKKSS